MMPGMTGFEVLQAVQTEPRWSDLPVMLITAAADESLPASAMRSGAVDVLIKPFRLSELLEPRGRAHPALPRGQRRAPPTAPRAARRRCPAPPTRSPRSSSSSSRAKLRSLPRVGGGDQELASSPRETISRGMTTNSVPAARQLHAVPSTIARSSRSIRPATSSSDPPLRSPAGALRPPARPRGAPRCRSPSRRASPRAAKPGSGQVAELAPGRRAGDGDAEGVHPRLELRPADLLQVAVELRWSSPGPKRPRGPSGGGAGSKRTRMRRPPSDLTQRAFCRGRSPPRPRTWTRRPRSRFWSGRMRLQRDGLRREHRRARTSRGPRSAPDARSATRWRRRRRGRCAQSASPTRARQPRPEPDAGCRGAERV